MTASPLKARPQIADADYYRLGYQLAAQLMNRAAATPAAPAAVRGAPAIVNDDPLAIARQLLADARTLLRWYEARRSAWMRWRRPTAQEDRLETFLHATIEPCCALIAARRLHQLGRHDEAAPLVAQVLERARAGELSYRAYYALACLEANAGDGTDAIEYLGRALHEAPRARRAELARWAASDPAFAPLREAVLALLRPAGEAQPSQPSQPPREAQPSQPPREAPSGDDLRALESAVDERRERPLELAAARVRLASAYQLAERTEEAVALDDRVARALTELLGPDHRASVTAREVLQRSRRLLRSAPDRPALARRALELREALLQALPAGSD